MDSEELRQIYNKNYAQSDDRWSLTDLKQTTRIINRIITYISKHGFVVDPGKKSLDIGCAKGHHTESFRRAGFIAHGLDYSEIAIEIAENNFPKCVFFWMDGLAPTLKETYDVILMKGFSGINTHNLDFVADLCRKYLRHLNNGGWFIMAFSSDFSGKERPGDTVSWSRQEIRDFTAKFEEVKLVGVKYFSYGLMNNIARKVLNAVGIRKKEYFYLFFQRQY